MNLFFLKDQVNQEDQEDPKSKAFALVQKVFHSFIPHISIATFRIRRSGASSSKSEKQRKDNWDNRNKEMSVPEDSHSQTLASVSSPLPVTTPDEAEVFMKWKDNIHYLFKHSQTDKR